ncbi:MAG: HAD hydrolase family protein [Dehalococcoidales bacterium]|nr:HAD hydrolase family protein [Dehalococcoidales bacterium]
MSLNRIKLIAVDLDGTLLVMRVSDDVDEQDYIPAASFKGVRYRMAGEGAKALKTAARNGVHIIITTSRVINSVRDLCSSLELTSPVICAGGAQIYESIAGPLWKSLALPEEIAVAVTEYADSNGWPLSINCGEDTCYGGYPEEETGEISPGRMKVVKNRDGVRGDVHRILVHGSEAIKGIKEFCEENLSGKCRIESHTGPDGGSLGVFSIDATKGNALDAVMKHLGVTPPEVMAIGDDLNDLSMFSRAGTRIAMGNAQPELKTAATAVAPTNDDEGVAWALREFGVIS